MRTLVHWLAIVALSTFVSNHALASEKLQAEDFAIANYQGKVLYLDFWASWCTPCRASFPFMEKLAKEHESDLAIVAINVDSKREDADAFLANFATPFDIVFDPEGELASKFEVPGMPTSFLFDRNGQLIGKHVGFRKKDQDKLQQWIAESLAAP